MSNEMTKVEKAILLGVKEINRKMKDQRQIDWEQRRYEVARDILAGYVCNGGDKALHLRYNKEIQTTYYNEVKNAVFLADALIAELKKGGEK